MQKIFSTTLQRKIGGLFLAFFLLVLLSLVVTSWARSVQQQNALLLNLANRQKTLVQQITRDARELEGDREDETQHILALRVAADTFEQTLWALTNGGKAPYLPNQTAEVAASQNPDITSRLHQVHHTWDIFRGYLNLIAAVGSTDPDFIPAIRSVERLSPQLIQESDELARLYETISIETTVRLRWLQAAFFVGALGLLAVGFLVMQRSVTSPLDLLVAVTERIGRGDLNTPVEITGPREIEAMALSLDTLRIQLNNSQTELVKRAERLEARVARRRHELSTAFEFSQDMISELDLEELASSVTDRARTLMQAQVARLCLLASDGEAMDLVAWSGQDAIPPACRQTDGDCLIAQVIGADAARGANLACAGCHSAQIQGFGHALATPLRAGEHALGSLCVIRTGPKGFDQDEARALTLLANSAAIAFANASLVESSRRQAEQMSALAERERLAADLHDNVAQTLGFLNLKAEQLHEIYADGADPAARIELDQIRLALSGAYEEIRITLAALRQPAITADEAVSGQALVEELAAYLDDFQENSGLLADLTVTAPSDLVLSPTVQKQAFNLVREALTNVRRHARARQVRVCIERTPERDDLQLTVQDDGCGFDPASVQEEHHLGLMIMRARAERCGGDLTIDSALESGTKIVARFPLRLN